MDNKEKYVACNKDIPPQDWTDYELPDIDVSKEKYDRWKTNCLRNKTRSSWLYLIDEASMLTEQQKINIMVNLKVNGVGLLLIKQARVKP